jgi:hypothetical protein
MGRTLLGACLLACFVVASAGCSPLYGGKPEKLANPPKKKKPKEVEEAEPTIVYVEDCAADFRDDPRKAQKQTSMSRQLTEAGVTALDQADKAKEDQVKLGLIRESIDKLRNALIKDPYNVEATLQLALAYDKVLRKGCAIAMLKRLAALSNHNKWQSEANRNIDAIDANGQWFKGYRKDAMSAVGR